ncbi:MAG: putative sugar transporter, substrate-binding protein [Conexibacter sp.]|nr:putative sugar transporter, substrate-binding protein [Conexibacter sp.]
MQRRFVLLLTVVGALALAVVVTACGSSKKSSSTSTGSAGASTTSSSSGSGGGKIALLLPENRTARYESQDRPLFEARVKELCPNCSVLYSNAEQDAAKQQAQAEAAITNGAKVLVVDAVDGRAAASIVTRAKQSKIPVIAYDRLISNSDLDYYVSFDNRRVGELQATSLVNRLRADGSRGNLVMINGAPTDANAAQFRAGAHSVLDSSGFRIAREYDTPDWSPDRAQAEMDQAITALGKTGFVGVYAANDGTGGAAIASMRSQGIDPATRPTTGQDAELAGIQRIVAGTQYMTVYKAIRPEAQDSATFAVALAQGKTPDATLVNTRTNNGQKDVPSVILTPVAVTSRNINDTVVRDGYWTAAQICTSAYAAQCRRLGIQ